MKVVMRPIESIEPYSKNPRSNDNAVEAVARSIKEFDWKQPIVVDGEGIILAGHTRWKAAQQLGMTEVPVVVANDLTPEQARAFRVADNQTHALSSWDLELLSFELGELDALNIDMSILGFSPDELAKFMKAEAKDGLTDPDEVPAPPDEATSQRGDIWALGDHHRLMVGDSASAEDVDQLLDGAEIHLVNTDPPYNVKVEPRSNNAIRAGLSSFPETKKRGHHQSFDVARQGEKKATSKKLRAKDRPLVNDFVSDEAFEQMLRAWFGNIARVLVPGGGFYIWGGYANIGNYPPVLRACHLYFSQSIIWVKEHPVLTRKDFMGNHEWCFYGWKEGAAHRFFGAPNVPDVWSVKKVNPASMIHLTEKPVELAARAIKYSSLLGENVLDLFGGSGSTLIACEQLGRRAYLMELDPLYADVIRLRYESFSGKKAELVSSASPEKTPTSAGVVAEEAKA